MLVERVTGPQSKQHGKLWVPATQSSNMKPILWAPDENLSFGVLLKFQVYFYDPISALFVSSNGSDESLHNPIVIFKVALLIPSEFLKVSQCDPVWIPFKPVIIFKMIQMRYPWSSNYPKVIPSDFPEVFS